MSDANFRVKKGLDVKDGIITVENGSIKIKERASAPANTAAYGQLWVKNTGDGLLYFTDDNGTDIQITTATAVNASGGASSIGGLSDAITTATSNIGLGSGALDSLTASSGNYNVALGINAGTAITEGDNSVAIGYNALKTATTQNEATAIGYLAGEDLAGGVFGSTAMGVRSLSNFTTGWGNTAVGHDAMWSQNGAGTGAQNTAIGYQAMKGGVGSGVGITGSFNVSLGSHANSRLANGTANVAVGHQANNNISSGSYNIGIGMRANQFITTGSRNIAIGHEAMNGFDTENDNIAIGFDALGATINGAEKNVVIGNSAGDAITSADNSVFVGYEAGSANQTGTTNTAVGYRSMLHGTGQQNVMVGGESGYGSSGSSTGSYNVMVGKESGYAYTTASSLTLVGKGAGSSITTGGSNTALGRNSLYAVVDGVNNIGIGKSAGDNITSGDYNVVIGDAQVPSATGDSQLVIASGNGGVTWITGASTGVVDFPNGLTSGGSAIGGGGDTNAGGVNGSASAPTFSFASDTNTGMYRLTGDTLAFSVGGTNAMFMQSSKVEANKRFEIIAGSNTAPGLSLAGDDNTGIYRYAENQIGFTIDGTAQLFIKDGAIEPVTDNDIDLGTSTKNFNDAFLSGDLNISSQYGRINFKKNASGNVNNDAIFFINGSDQYAGGVKYFHADNSLRLMANQADQLYITDGAIYPPVDNDVDIGTSTYEFKDGYFDGTLHCDVLDLAGTEYTSIGGASAIDDLSDASTSGTSNVALGSGALSSRQNNQFGSNHCTLVGYQAGNDLTTGADNVAIGSLAGANLTVGSSNIAIGRSAMNGDTASVHGIAIGSQTGEYSTGDYNISMGAQSGRYLSGNYNIAIGVMANDSGSNSGSGNVVIGNKQDLDDDTTDRNLIIAGNDGTNTTTWIKGNSSGVVDFPNGTTGAGSFYITAEEANWQLNIGVSNGFHWSFGNGADIGDAPSPNAKNEGIALPVDCTLKFMHLNCANDGNDAAGSSATVQIYKATSATANQSAVSNASITATVATNGHGISATADKDVDFNKGDVIVFRSTTANQSGIYVGRGTISAYFVER